MSAPTVSYAAVLRRLGLKPSLRYPWALVGQTRRVQGWKLHVSSVQAQAPNLLACVVPILRANRVSFKVAEHDGILALLNEGDMGATQVGKFLTIYPESDERALELADQLIAATGSFSGPEIPTDRRLGSVVFARYGSFNPIIKRDRIGSQVAMIESADGALVPDRYSMPFSAPSHVTDPFAGRIVPAAGNGNGHPSSSSANQLIGPGYRILKPIKVRPAGGAMLAIDLRSQDRVGLKVLKFGRPHCLSDAQGRDIRDRLKQQAALHAALATLVSVPSADPYFEHDQNGYVALEHIEGRDFEHLRISRVAHQPWHCLPFHVQGMLLRRVVDAIGAVRQLHAVGYIHRDLSPSNLWVARNGRVFLLDLELAYPIGGSTPPFGLGTEGFMSPQQAGRELPTVADDVYAIGCVLTFVLARLDPRRIIFSPDRYRRQRFVRLIQGASPELFDIICACLDDDAERRPDLAIVQQVVAKSAKARHNRDMASRGVLAPPFSVRRSKGAATFDARLGDVLKRGQQSLIAEADARGGLWLSSRSASHSNRAAGTYDAERYANRGVAGVVYLMARLERFGYGSAAAKRTIRRAVQWLLETEPAAADRIPGLHFGEAGVAVAISEAIAAGLVERDERIDGFLQRSLNGQLDWPDVTHGAAGQGIAAFACADQLGDLTLLNHAHHCAEDPLRGQASDGSWTLPPGIDGLSGQTLTGFAHGAAGMIWFLTEYLNRFEHRDVTRPVRAAKAWLLARAVKLSNGERLEWPYGTAAPQRWHWWCHGGPGIALAFLKLYERTQDRRDAEVVRRALRVHHAEIRYANLTQCHGLSGLGEIYLEAARVLREDEWRVRAVNIAEELLSLAREGKNGALAWFVEDLHYPTADLMVGYGGVLHFLLRLTEGRGAPGFPLLPDSTRG